MKTQPKLTQVTYSVAIEVAKSPSEVFRHLIDLNKWWLEDFVGEEIQMNAEFILKTGDGHFSKNKVIQFEPNKNLTWIATESLRKADNYDWSGSKFIFELTAQHPRSESPLTQLQFTYDGVVLENEFEILRKVCDMAIKEKFYDFIINGQTKFNNELE